MRNLFLACAGIVGFSAVAHAASPRAAGQCSTDYERELNGSSVRCRIAAQHSQALFLSPDPSTI
jgi:hypothetical protein